MAEHPSPSLSPSAPVLLVLGAGKIGRGFIAHLASRSGWRIRVADRVPGLIASLAQAGSYLVEVAGTSVRDRVAVEQAVLLTDAPALAQAVADTDLLACAVGAPNLAGLAQALALALTARARAQPTRPLDWLILENADQPAALLRRELLAHTPADVQPWIETRLGLVETQVLRSGLPVEPALAQADPLRVRMHDWWTLPVDRDAFRAPIPALTGLDPRSPFTHELQRKLYTFNGLNGPIAYLGWINGYRVLHEAACAPELQAILHAVHEESAHGLIAEYGFDPAEHRAFQAIAWHKYRDPALADAIERNARDSARKLGPRERLVGPAALCQRHGRAPIAYATAIAAAMRYEGSDDPGTAQVQATLRHGGVPAVLASLCQIAPESALGQLVIDADRRQAWRLQRLAQGPTA